MSSKLGFSDSFSCCSHWQHCLMGVDSCYYDSIDPKVKEGCHCYQRNHGDVKTPAQQEGDLFTQGDQSSSEQQEETYSTGADGQLSLF